MTTKNEIFASNLAASGYSNEDQLKKSWKINRS